MLQPAPEPLLSERQLSELTGISVSTLQSYRHQRQHFPYYKIGRNVRYRLSEVMHYLGACQVRCPNNNAQEQQDV